MESSSRTAPDPNNTRHMTSTQWLMSPQFANVVASRRSQRLQHSNGSMDSPALVPAAQVTMSAGPPTPAPLRHLAFVQAAYGLRSFPGFDALVGREWVREEPKPHDSPPKRATRAVHALLRDVRSDVVVNVMGTRDFCRHDRYTHLEDTVPNVPTEATETLTATPQLDAAAARLTELQSEKEMLIRRIKRDDAHLKKVIAARDRTNKPRKVVTPAPAVEVPIKPPPPGGDTHSTRKKGPAPLPKDATYGRIRLAHEEARRALRADRPFRSWGGTPDDARRAPNQRSASGGWPIDDADAGARLVDMHLEAAFLLEAVATLSSNAERANSVLAELATVSPFVDSEYTIVFSTVLRLASATAGVPVRCAVVDRGGECTMRFLCLDWQPSIAVFADDRASAETATTLAPFGDGSDVRCHRLTSLVAAAAHADLAPHIHLFADDPFALCGHGAAGALAVVLAPRLPPCSALLLHGSPQVFPAVADKHRAMDALRVCRQRPIAPAEGGVLLSHFALAADPWVHQPTRFCGGGSGIGTGVVVPGPGYAPHTPFNGLLEVRLIPGHEADDVGAAAMDEAEPEKLQRRKMLHRLHLEAVEADEHEQRSGRMAERKVGPALPADVPAAQRSALLLPRIPSTSQEAQKFSRLSSYTTVLLEIWMDARGDDAQDCAAALKIQSRRCRHPLTSEAFFDEPPSLRRLPVELDGLCNRFYMPMWPVMNCTVLALELSAVARDREQVQILAAEVDFYAAHRPGTPEASQAVARPQTVHNFSPLLVKCILSMLPPSPLLARATAEERTQAEERRRQRYLQPDGPAQQQAATGGNGLRALLQSYRSNPSLIPVASLVLLLDRVVRRNNEAYEPTQHGRADPEKALERAVFQLPLLALADLVQHLEDHLPPHDDALPVDRCHVPVMESTALLAWAWSMYCHPLAGPRLIFALLTLPILGTVLVEGSGEERIAEILAPCEPYNYFHHHHGCGYDSTWLAVSQAAKAAKGDPLFSALLREPDAKSLRNVPPAVRAVRALRAAAVSDATGFAAPAPIMRGPGLSKAAEAALGDLFHRHGTAAPISPLDRLDGPAGAVMHSECLHALFMHHALGGVDRTLPLVDPARGVPLAAVLAETLCATEDLWSRRFASGATKKPLFRFAGEMTSDGFLAFCRILGRGGDARLRQLLTYHGYNCFTLAFEPIPPPPLVFTDILQRKSGTRRIYRHVPLHWPHTSCGCAVHAQHSFTACTRERETLREGMEAALGGLSVAGSRDDGSAPVQRDAVSKSAAVLPDLFQGPFPPSRGLLTPLRGPSEKKKRLRHTNPPEGHTPPPPAHEDIYRAHVPRQLNNFQRQSRGLDPLVPIAVRELVEQFLSTYHGQDHASAK